LPFHKQGRDFLVFERGGVKFGVVICSDGGYVEPSRILALKGARVIFSPHFNYIGKEGLIYFVRGNNVVLGKDPAITKSDGVGYGDSYIVDPYGELVVRSRRHQEDFLFVDVDPAVTDRVWKVGRSLWSVREFHKQLLDAAGIE
jgi:predicted amidohydrolase